jgi:hypothetical protein
LLLAIFSVNSYAGNFLLDVQIGSGDIKIDASEGGSIRTRSFDTVGGSIYGGYMFDNNIFTKVGFGRQSSDDIFGISDSATVKTYEALVGYAFDFDRFFLRPQVGVAHWRLEFKEGIFFNPGDEERINKSGDELVLLVDAGYTFTERLGLRLSHKIIRSDVGRYSASTVGLNIRFRY